MQDSGVLIVRLLQIWYPVWTPYRKGWKAANIPKPESAVCIDLKRMKPNEVSVVLNEETHMYILAAC